MTKERRNFAKTGSFMTQPQAKNNWVHYADAGTTLEDVQRPNYWCNVAGRMLLYDRLEVVFADLNAVADFVVLEIENVTKSATPNRSAQFAKLGLLNSFNLEKREEEQVLTNGDYSCKYLNPILRYGIMLNGVCIEDKIQTKEEAIQKTNKLNEQNA
jgi:hypothetical protein